ncbi:LysR family transcriptional regulator [Sphingomonas oleivorans]|uniref:LysR family transcriptional regulator n=1 Tax=Sphingomonas oleivorans TaxID=1735121 RepID=A0A2T5G064_9SPHN|nr:LysR family transcriptional regulator [Sphingomonas oleivorans]PTQ12334.1 LysR family transcriptional regulator [Sphingomonas oleivorans]
MIDRYLLRYFLAVVDYGSFSRAAAQMNVAQPTLSVGIAKLERLLGTPLFVRSSQRVHLTEAGSRFAAHARRIEREFNLAETALVGIRPRPTIRIGILSSIPTDILAGFVAAEAAGAREERYEIIEGGERDLLQRLARGRVDVALTIVRPENDRFARETLLSEGYALALPAGHPLADRESIAGEALADDVMIVRRHCEILSETSRYFTERGVRPFFALRTTNDDRALAMVRAGMGVTVMPESYRAEGVARPGLAGFALRRDIGLLFAAHAEMLQQGSPLVDLLRCTVPTFSPLS